MQAIQNRIPQVDKVRREMSKGWPHGTDSLHRDVPVLMARIEELEHALRPFARIALINGKYVAPEKVTETYMRDCIHAADMLNEQLGYRPVDDQFFSMPAE